jgi:hypothetical protein
MDLKFFKTRTAPNRNYVVIVESGTFCIKREELDHCELQLLEDWFSSYSRNACRDLHVKLHHNLDNGAVYLKSDKVMGEVYTNPELLKDRIEQLHQIEADFFSHLNYIKQPKF